MLSRQRDGYTVAPPLLRAGGVQGFSDVTGSEEEPDDLGGRTSELRRTFTRSRRCHIPLAPSTFWLPAPSPSFERRRRTGQRAVGRPRFVVVVLRLACMAISVLFKFVQAGAKIIYYLLYWYLYIQYIYLYILYIFIYLCVFTGYPVELFENLNRINNNQNCLGPIFCSTYIG